MKVFLSWSGERSHAVAVALKDWLPQIINSLEPWLSSEDIEKGSAWSSNIAKALGESSFGIICLTQDNQQSNWLNFEAGAIGKAMLGGVDPHVATFLVDIDSDVEVKGPLAQFQSTKPQLSDVQRLVRDLNKAAGTPRTDDQLERAVQKWWSDLDDQLHAIANRDRRPRQPKREPQDILEELLSLTRELVRIEKSSKTRYEAFNRAIQDELHVQQAVDWILSDPALTAGLTGVEIDPGSRTVTFRSAARMAAQVEDQLDARLSNTGFTPVFAWGDPGGLHPGSDELGTYPEA